MPTLLVAYVPVLHEGYRKFFESQRQVKEIAIFDSEIIREFYQLGKEIRQIDPIIMRGLIDSLRIFEKVSLLGIDKARLLNDKNTEIILPDEDVSRELASKYFPEAKVKFEKIFLRWDKHNSLKEKPVVSDENITRDEFHRAVIIRALEISKKSSDIWRHVGAIIVKDGGEVLVGYNKHVPSEHMPYVDGDPRSNFHKGEYIEISTALHAEAGLIAEAARRGVSLQNSDMYVTVFPCPPCAKLIAYSGIKNLYCGGGYGVLDGESILKSRGVKIIFVE